MFPVTINEITKDNGMIRAMAVIDYAFGGLNNAPHLKETELMGEKFWTVKTRDVVATFDDGVLTRLVVAAHQYCVRVSISGTDNGRLNIVLQPRWQRLGGEADQRHPDVDALKMEGE